MSTITGYKQDQEGAWIAKDRLAALTYSMDWTNWLATGQTVTAVTYTITPPTYNPTPLVIATSGIMSGNKITYVKLSAGTVNKIYTVTAAITTDDGSTDRRQFRLKIENRSA
jgi:hypothetical protein